MQIIEVDALRNSGNGPALVTSVVPAFDDAQGNSSFSIVGHIVNLCPRLAT